MRLEFKCLTPQPEPVEKLKSQKSSIYMGLINQKSFKNHPNPSFLKNPKIFTHF